MIFGWGALGYLGGAVLTLGVFYSAIRISDWRAHARSVTREVTLTVCRICCDTFVPHDEDATLDDDLKNVCHVCRGDVVRTCARCQNLFYKQEGARLASERTLCGSCRVAERQRSALTARPPITLATLRQRALNGDFAEDGGPARPERPERPEQPEQVARDDDYH